MGNVFYDPKKPAPKSTEQIKKAKGVEERAKKLREKYDVSLDDYRENTVQKNGELLKGNTNTMYVNISPNPFRVDPNNLPASYARKVGDGTDVPETSEDSSATKKGKTRLDAYKTDNPDFAAAFSYGQQSKFHDGERYYRPGEYEEASTTGHTSNAGDREWHLFTADLPEEQRKLQHNDRIKKGLVPNGTLVPLALSRQELHEEMMKSLGLFKNQAAGQKGTYREHTDRLIGGAYDGQHNTDTTIDHLPGAR
ncbi:unnamed protein product [Clonostachys byssicola]|uniref:Uncharacterized protein n=1 Tax=Clonostachys byssicola TaxID=160290 RepID=A0A9N9UU89_9HYPO|nr:unnamed protein product [Clonostachys byssicola]